MKFHEIADNNFMKFHWNFISVKFHEIPILKCRNTSARASVCGCVYASLCGCVYASLCVGVCMQVCMTWVTGDFEALLRIVLDK